MLVKICGFTRIHDIQRACELGADAVGVILVEGSKRQVSVGQARELLSAASVARVVVCKPSSAKDLVELEQVLSPDYFQFHPSTELELIAQAKSSLSSGIIAVLPVPTAQADFGRLLERARKLEVFSDFILLDTQVKEGGGSGRTHDWEVDRKLRERLNKPILLAGGLNPENVVEAIRIVQPAGVDVATVEELNVLLLAPGGHPGRLTVWTESAIKKLAEHFS